MRRTPSPRAWRPAAAISAAVSAAAVSAAVIACQPATTRPPFPPVPEAAISEVRLPAGEATRLLAEAFRADSMPMRRVEVRDGWLETSWFDAASGSRVAHRPLGSHTVRVRAWAEPTHPGNSKVTVETVYRPLADPSLPERELDRQVPRDHPVAIKVRAALQDLVKRYGGPPAPPPAAAPRGEQVEAGPEDQGPPEEQAAPENDTAPDQGAPSEGAPDQAAPNEATVPENAPAAEPPASNSPTAAQPPADSL